MHYFIVTITVTLVKFKVNWSTADYPAAPCSGGNRPSSIVRIIAGVSGFLHMAN